MTETGTLAVRRGAARAPASVELHGVVSIVHGFPVLAGVDLRIEAGAVVLVSGPNGAGKTSLLRLLAGQLPVTAGTATVLGAPLRADPSAHRRRVALVGAEPSGYDDLTVRRNVMLHARVAGATRRRCEEVLDLLGLTAIADVPHGRLSSGQRRRCSLAVGLVRDVELLLLDEPHSALDAAARDLVDLVVATAAATGTTVVIVSHELDRARALAGREVMMDNGVVIQD